VEYTEIASETLRPDPSPETAFAGSETVMVRAIQAARGEEVCFRTELRLQCTYESCEWRRRCRRLVAEWKR